VNSLRMYVEDAVGDKFLFTCATNRPGQAASFRRHANWWLRRGYRHTVTSRQPCFPCKVVIEPYQDDTAI
jgi:hypothetical protein